MTTILAATALDWGVIINAISLGIVMVLTAWVKLGFRDNRRDQARLQKTLNRVQIQTDGAITAAKLAVAISAKNLALVTKLPRDEKVAREAEAAHAAQVEIQARAENPQPQ